MTIYKKLNEARQAFHKMNLKKSGINQFAGYSYFELSDFLVPGMQCLSEAGLVPVVSFEPSRAIMRLHEIDGDGVIEIESPRAAANLKGCHPIQNLGAEETYQRRYLWMAALEIVEHDAVDSSQPVEKITESQEVDLKTLIDEVGAEHGEAMLKWAGVSELSDLPADKYKMAVKALEAKRSA